MTTLLFGGAVPSKDQSYVPPVQPECGSGRHLMHVDFRHREGRWIGYHSGYTTAETYIVPNPIGKNWRPIFDARGHYFNNDRWAANGGIGVRYLPTDWCSVWGMNGFYDFRTTHRRGFHRVGVGMEYLARQWEARANGYIPVNSTGPHIHRRTSCVGGTLTVREKQNLALYGGDVEVGGLYTYGDLRVFGGGGPYAFTHKDVRTAVGAKARVSALYLDVMHLEMTGSWDTLFHGRIQGEVALVIPFGPRRKLEVRPCLAECREARELQDRFYDRIERLEIIALKERNLKQTGGVCAP